ncbi:hypothetical protein NA57DRAFT_57561 [Rhizodiscina lignyota]|uniref:Uncharacterized protein n=1 Tax=Rhizodiscina lignyota TaxID=1504668 RepID=A0A9P4IEY0_9PEZI|nr:hypothetical protein NA57DRAFT_57561 [Rhizodiscina lignyota]
MSRLRPSTKVKISKEDIDDYYEQKQEYVDILEAQTGELKPYNKEPKWKTAAQTKNMPVMPKEDETSSHITDQVAKESSDSTASTHKLHQDAHKANLGPVQTDNLPEPASKEELKKRAEELNK